MSTGIYPAPLGTGSGSGGTLVIPELTSDPVSPSPEQAWVLYTFVGGSGSGSPIGLLLALTYAGGGGGTATYQFSYQTIEGPIKRVTLS